MTDKRHDDDRHERGDDVTCSGDVLQPNQLDPQQPEPLAARPFTEEELKGIPEQEPCLFYVVADDSPGEGEGVVAKGFVSMIAGAAGAGKSNLALAMMFDAANGGHLFGDKRAGVPYVKEQDAGRVLYLSLEDTREQVGRRLKRILAARSLPPAALARIHVEAWDDPDIAGSPRTLIKFDQRTCSIEEHPLYLRATATLKQSKEPWSLIVVDTFARSALGDVETNPEAATALLQRLEAWTLMRGKPVVLVIHHSRKAGSAAKLAQWLDDSLSAEATRGSSAILGTVRWLGMLARLRKPKHEEFKKFDGLAKHNLFFEVAKANGVATDAMARLHLVIGSGGVLRIATPVEQRAANRLLQKGGSEHGSTQNGETRNNAGSSESSYEDIL